MSQLRRLALGALCVVAGAAAAAEESKPQVWLNPGIYSFHFDRNQGFRENNIGFGAEVILVDDHAVMAGTFINSDRDRSRFLGYQWRPWHWQPTENLRISAGVIVAALDGYPRMNNGGWFVAPLPVLAIEGRRVGANLSIIPEVGDRLHGAVAVQIKLRVW